MWQLFESSAQESSALYYISLHCTAMHITWLNSTPLPCTGVHYPLLQCNQLHYTAEQCTAITLTAVHSTVLHYTILRITALYGTELHCVSLYRKVETCHQIWLHFSASWKYDMLCICFHETVSLPAFIRGCSRRCSRARVSSSGMEGREGGRLQPVMGRCSPSWKYECEKYMILIFFYK